MLILLAMNINWEEHGHPGNYTVRNGTLIRAVNDYLDELNLSNEPYHGFASHLTNLGSLKKEVMDISLLLSLHKRGSVT